MCKRYVVLLLLIVAVATSCRSVQFYKETDKPFYYSGKDTFTARHSVDSLNVVTFNIKKARKIELAITELRQFEQNRDVDIYLLQEMDEKGTEAIAKALQLNYLYIPIVYDVSDKKNIGNAILTRGTIDKPEKLILPHAKWQNQQRRDVTIGEVNIHNKKILVYSIHTETFAMSRKKRLDQVNGIIEHAKLQMPDYQYLLIGGDFNTLFPQYRNMVISNFKKNGFDWSTQTVGTTARGMMGLVKPQDDFMFTKGLKLVTAKRIEDSKSSDHYPVVSTFMF